MKDMLEGKDRDLFLFTIIHSCDIAHTTRGPETSDMWSARVIQEFWAQGDQEKSMGLPISFGCDRNSFLKPGSVPKFQLNFLDFIVNPL